MMAVIAEAIIAKLGGPPGVLAWMTSPDQAVNKDVFVKAVADTVVRGAGGADKILAWLSKPAPAPPGAPSGGISGLLSAAELLATSGAATATTTTPWRRRSILKAPPSPPSRVPGPLVSGTKRALDVSAPSPAPPEKRARVATPDTFDVFQIVRAINPVPLATLKDEAELCKHIKTHYIDLHESTLPPETIVARLRAAGYLPYPWSPAEFDELKAHVAAHRPKESATDMAYRLRGGLSHCKSMQMTLQIVNQILADLE
jgi:hypothetical protein